MKKILMTWGSLCVLSALVVALTRWANHPDWVKVAQTSAAGSALFAFILGWFLRLLILRKKAEWVRGLGLAFVLFWIQKSFLVPVIPSHDFAQRILWPWLLVFCLFQFLYLAWEEWASFLEELPGIRSVPVFLWSVFLTLGLLVLAVNIRLHPNLTPQGGWTPTENFKNLALVLTLFFWGAETLFRQAVLKKEPRVFHALGLLLFSLLLYRGFPDFMDWSYVDPKTLRKIDHQWTPYLVFLHVLFPASLAAFWEKLYEKGMLIRGCVLGLAGFSWMVSAYFNPGNPVWFYQILGLASLWAWEPWLKNRWWAVLRVVAAWYFLDQLSQRGNYRLDFLVLLFTAVALGWRVALEKNQAFILRTFWVILFAAILFSHYQGNSGYFPWQRFLPDWLLTLHLSFSVIAAVYWERFRDRKDYLWKLFLAAGSVLSIVGFFYESFLWFLHLAGLALAWAWDGFGSAERLRKLGERLTPEEKKKTVPFSAARKMEWGAQYEALINQGWMKVLRKILKAFGTGAGKGIKQFLASRKTRRGAFGLLLAVLLYVGGVYAYRHLATYVVSMTPNGIVQNLSTVVRVKFSDSVRVEGDLQKALSVTPPLPGVIRLEDDTTLVLNPSEPLRPATQYEVLVDGSVLKSRKGYLQQRAKLKFRTPAFKVESTRLFYTFDLAKNEEKGLAGELAFNYPVELNLLKEHLSVFQEGKELSAFLEPGTLPNQFYFRADGLKKEFEKQTLKIRITKGLNCINGAEPLEDDYVQTLELAAKPRFRVESIQVHNQPGSSLIAVLFSHPVSRDQVKNHILIYPSLPINFQSEYCYAVLRAEFKPNVNYSVVVDGGIQALDGQVLGSPVTQTVYIRDSNPQVRFADRGRLIPLGTDPQVAVKSINLDDYRYNVRKVFRNNLVGFLKNSYEYSNSYYNNEDEDGEDGGYQYNRRAMDRWSESGLGTQVASGPITVQGGQINEEVETIIDFSKWQSAPWKGLFTVEINDPRGSARDSRWFLATDLGLLAKKAGDDLWVQVLSIGKVLPEAGVRLSLVSDTNQVIQEATTDLNGRAWFKNWKNNPYNFQPLVIVAEKGEDWSFLRLNQGELNNSRFDVGGEAFTTEGWDGFLTSDRGLYRPGDMVHLTGVVRNADLSTPTDFPIRLRIMDTDGTEIKRLPAKLSGSGMAVFDFLMRENFTTGTYQATLEMETGRVLARTEFKMEEFIPNKIKAEVVPQAKVAEAGEQLVYDVKARHLFGAAASGLKVRTTVRLEDAVFKSKLWEDYKFSDNSRAFQSETLSVPGGETDEKGVYSARLPVPLTILPASMLRAVVYAEVFDTGGRPVGAASIVDVHRYPLYLGLKSDSGRQVSPGEKVNLRYVSVNANGKLIPAGTIQLVVKRKVWYSVFRQSGWSGRGFESSFYEETVVGKEVTLDGKGSYRFTPDKPGEYTVYLGNPESMRTSLTFVATGLGSSPDQAESVPTNLEAPEKLSLSLDKKNYKPGEIPRLEVRAPFAGTLVVSLEREKVFFTKTLAVPAGLSVVELPSPDQAYFPNVYVTGVLVRPPLESLRNLPGVSFGVIPLLMDLSSREVAFKWDSAKSVKSRDGIAVSLDTGSPGAQVVLTAVDEGILQIINFKTPDPFSHFYRKRSLGVLTLSLFDDVLPALDRRQSVGGGEGAPEFAMRHLNPVAAKRVKSFALFSGILTADSTGKVTYKFPTDKFHGEVRVMALAVDGRKFGASSYSVEVADPIVVEPSFPRFLAPKDNFDVPVLLYNQKEVSQEISVVLKADGPVAVDGESSQKVTLPPKGQKTVTFHAKAKNNAGKAVFKVTATDPEGGVYDVETELSVRPGNPLTTEVHFGEVAPGKDTSLSVPGGFISQGQRVRLVASSSPLLTFLRSLDYLLGYPYGCTEQLTSQGFPLLYFGDMGLLTGRFSGRAGELQRFVQSAVDEIQARQDPDGSFAPWPSSTRRSDYLSNYASHFLLEAKRKGFDVAPQTLERIRKRIGAIQIVQSGGKLDRRKANIEVNESTYVLLLKALAGVPDKETMNRFRGDGRKDFYLSLAFSQIQDRGSALQVLPGVKLPDNVQRTFWDDWFSPNKHAALYLLCLTRADPESPKIRQVVLEFGKKMVEGQFGSTQDNAWSFMALAEAVQTFSKNSPIQASWKLQGGVEKWLKGETDIVSDRALSGHQVVLANQGTQPLYYHLMAEGTKLESKVDNVSNGLDVSREYRDEKGNRVNLGSVSQGQLIVVTLRVKCAKAMDNLVVVDLLPGGFEVDNPRLASRGRLGFDPPCSLTPAYQDFRDDRVILFTDQVQGELTFSYGVRAVTPGRFQVPGLLAEAMYDPDLFGRSHENESLVVAPSH